MRSQNGMRASHMRLLISQCHVNFVMQLSYASEVAPHSDRTAFPRFFQSRPPFEMITESVAIFSIMDHFRWRRIATLTQDEIQFTRVRKLIKSDYRLYI